MRVPDHVAARIARYDPHARLRWGGDRWVIEHRGRDGRWVHVGSMRPEYLGDGSLVIAALARNDIWRGGGADQVAREMHEEEERARRKRETQRRQEYIDIAKEARDDIHRRMGLAIFNAGAPWKETGT